MIAEIFLTCALALPAAAGQYHLPFDKDDIKVVKMVTETVRKPKMNKRILIIGSEFEWQWSLSLRNHGFAAWRLVRGAVAKWDIEGSAFYQPILPGSMRMVIYLLDQPQKPENIQAVIRECAISLEPFGFLVFDDEKAPGLKEFLPKDRWFRLPFRWHSMLIYQKLDKKSPLTVGGTPEREHGWWEIFLKSSA